MSCCCCAAACFDALQAVSEPEYSEMYADLYQIIRWRSPDFTVPGEERKINFHRTFVNRCQDEFERCVNALLLRKYPFVTQKKDKNGEKRPEKLSLSFYPKSCCTAQLAAVEPLPPQHAFCLVMLQFAFSPFFYVFIVQSRTICCLCSSQTAG